MILIDGCHIYKYDNSCSIYKTFMHSWIMHLTPLACMFSIQQSQYQIKKKGKVSH